MQPRPIAETSRPLFPSLRFCIVSPPDGVLNRFGARSPEMRRKPGTDTNFRRSLPEFGCLSQGLPNGTGRPFVVSPKRLSTPPDVFRLISSLGPAAIEAVSRSFRFLAYFSWVVAPGRG